MLHSPLGDIAFNLWSDRFSFLFFPSWFLNALIWSMKASVKNSSYDVPWCWLQLRSGLSLLSHAVTVALRFNSQCCALRACYSMASISAHFLVHKVNLHKNEAKVKILPMNWTHEWFEITLGEHRNTRGVFKSCLLIFKLAGRGISLSFCHASEWIQ